MIEMHTLTDQDGRTREARLLRTARAELLAHFGAQPSVSQSALIESCARMCLHVARMDQRMTAGKVSEEDARAYVVVSDALNAMLRQLEREAAIARNLTSHSGDIAA